MCDHGHSHGGGSGGHDHGGDDIGVGNFNLFLKINFSQLNCLNETVEGSAKSVFRPWEERNDTTRYVDSDADEELLINVPFTGNVKLKGIVVIGGSEDSAPSRLRLFKNRPHMTFDDTSMAADQEFQLSKDTSGVVEYPTKIVKFSNVHSVSLHFPANFGEDSTRIYYVGLRGDFTEAQREGVLMANYELAPNPADHKIDNFKSVHSYIR